MKIIELINKFHITLNMTLQIGLGHMKFQDEHMFFHVRF